MLGRLHRSMIIKKLRTDGKVKEISTLKEDMKGQTFRLVIIYEMENLIEK